MSLDTQEFQGSSC